MLECRVLFECPSNHIGAPQKPYPDSAWVCRDLRQLIDFILSGAGEGDEHKAKEFYCISGIYFFFPNTLYPGVMYKYPGGQGWGKTRNTLCVGLDTWESQLQKFI